MAHVAIRPHRAGDEEGYGITAVAAQDLVKLSVVQPGCRGSVAKRAFTGPRATAADGRVQAVSKSSLAAA